MKLFLDFAARLALFFPSFTGLGAPAATFAWKPIGPEEFALKAPIVEPDADAEALFWEIRLEDDISGYGARRTTYEHYLRVKVFTEKGKESVSRVDLPYVGENRILDIQARTTKPDGTTATLAKDGVFDRTIVKAGGVSVKAKSFALPAVVPGAIVEYRWKETRWSGAAPYVPVSLQREIPVQKVSLTIRVLSSEKVAIKTRAFRCQPTPFIKEKEGSTTTVTMVPALREEPFMPPTDVVRAWVLLYYFDDDDDENPDVFWKKYGKSVFESFRPSMKPNGNVRRTATQVIGDATDPEEKLRRLFEACRTRVKNVLAPANGYTPEARAKLKRNVDPDDTLDRGYGTPLDVNLLFASLAQAAGFDARVALLGDRERFFFNSSLAHTYFLSTYNIAVKVGEAWRFFDPGDWFLPWGSLRWQEEVSQALITDPKEPIFVRTPLSPPEKTVRGRKATLTLASDGTLEGDVVVELSGHAARDERVQRYGETKEEREKRHREAVQARMPNAEVTNVTFGGLDGSEPVATWRYHVRVPGFGARTSKRLVFSPAFFQNGVPALFPASDRRFEIYFPYAFVERDEIRLEVPAEFAFESTAWAEPFSIAGVGDYGAGVALESDGRTLAFTRSVRFTGGFFKTADYVPLKRGFDRMAEADARQVSLRLKTP